MPERQRTPQQQEGLLIPAAIVADRRLGPAVKLAYAVLWDWSGCRPSTISVGAAALAEACGRKDGRSAREWLEKLDEAGLVDYERDDRGIATCYVHGPGELGQLRRREHREDGQRELFDTEERRTQATPTVLKLASGEQETESDTMQLTDKSADILGTADELCGIMEGRQGVFHYLILLASYLIEFGPLKRDDVHRLCRTAKRKRSGRYFVAGLKNLVNEHDAHEFPPELGAFDPHQRDPQTQKLVNNFPLKRKVKTALDLAGVAWREKWD